MEWKDLSIASKWVLERCWGLRDDNPRSFSVSIGGKFRDGSLVTEDTYKEILEYNKFDTHFDVERTGNVITVRGIVSLVHGIKSR